MERFGQQIVHVLETAAHNSIPHAALKLGLLYFDAHLPNPSPNRARGPN
jgi:hypothetical protein